MHVSMTHFRKAAVCALVPLAVAVTGSSALAQKVGTYTGTNNEGQQVQVVVASVNGGLAVTGISDGGAVYCKGTQVATYGVAIGLSGQPIMNRRAAIDLLVINLYFSGDLKFAGNTVSGQLDFAVPVFNTTKQPPRQACAATTMKQTFTATFGGAALHVPPAGTAYVVPKATPCRCRVQAVLKQS